MAGLLSSSRMACSWGLMSRLNGSVGPPPQDTPTFSAGKVSPRLWNISETEKLPSSPRVRRASEAVAQVCRWGREGGVPTSMANILLLVSSTRRMVSLHGR